MNCGKERSLSGTKFPELSLFKCDMRGRNSVEQGHISLNPFELTMPAAEQIEREMRRQLHAKEFLGQQERITIRDALQQFHLSKKGTANHKNLLIHARILNRLAHTSRYLDELTSEDLEWLKRDRLHSGAILFVSPPSCPVVSLACFLGVGLV